MEAIEIYVSSASAKVVHAPEITKGTVGLPVRFTFDEAWKGLGKTAVFSAGGVTKDRVGILVETTVPPEVLAQAGVILEIGVYGTDTAGECVIPSRMATVDHIHDGADPTGDESVNPELPLWQQALAQFEQTNQILDDVKAAAQEARNVAAELEQARENGEFTGPQGEPGIVNINDASVSETSTWSSQKISGEMTALQEHDTRQDEALRDLNKKVTGLIDDSSRAADKTLSSQFIYEMFSYTDQLHQTWLKARVDDNATSADKTWSSQKLDGMFTEHNGAINELFTRVDGVVNDEYLSGGSTWSSNKLYGMFGEVESALDAILAMQNELIGGESV